MIRTCFDHNFPGVDRPSRSVWTAVALAPLFERTKIIHFSRVLVRPKAPLKPAQSKRFATLPAFFDLHP
jgi:hypothetical protein